MVDDITWLKEGVLKGKPSTAAGCETVCGTKQIWQVGVTPQVETEGKTNRQIISQIRPNLHQFVIKHIAKDSSGGACTSSYHSDEESTHKFETTVKHTYKGQRVIKDSEIIVIGGEATFIPITSVGNYSFKFKTLEWGENCNKPTNTGAYSVYVSETPESNGDDDDLNDCASQNRELTLSGNCGDCLSGFTYDSSTGVCVADDDNGSEFNPMAIAVIMLGGVGVFLLINTVFSQNS